MAKSRAGRPSTTDTRLDPPAWHRRQVQLSSAERRIEITDQVRTAGHHPLRLAFHLGPVVRSTLKGSAVDLTWSSHEGATTATLHLPADLDWSLVRGSTDPVVGWYSPHFGAKEPATTVLGEGTCRPGLLLETGLQFAAGGR